MNTAYIAILKKWLNNLFYIPNYKQELLILSQENECLRAEIERSKK